MPKNYHFFFVALLLAVLGVQISHAQEFTSTSYKAVDSVVNSGGYGTSTNFQVFGVIGQISTGTSTSLTFGNNAGFLYFPFASTPTVSATAGSAQVSLSWTASQGFVGWTASGYNIGRSTTSTGPYVYTSLGNVTSSTVTGLSNGTTYYFVVVVKDALGNAIATSTEVSSTPVASITPPSPTPSPGGGGGGGGGVIAPTPPPQSTAGVTFSGRAYPLSKVSFLKDGQLALTTIAGPDSKFTTTITNLSSGNYTFAVYSEDKNGVRSTPFTFPIYITSDVTTEVGGIFIAPTLSVDKTEVKKGDNIAIFGQSAQKSDIVISVNSPQEFILKKQSDANGIYLLNFDTSVLDMGQHTTKTKAATNGEISSFSNTVGFLVGTKNVAAVTKQGIVRGDANGDNRVNLVDFSILAYWYKKTLTPAAASKVDLNKDNRVDLVDFSIMAYSWTG